MERIITLAIADDHVYQTDMLAFRLSKFPHLRLIYAASDGRELIDYLATKPHPDVVLMDVRMPEMNGITATIHIREHYPDIKIIAYSQFDSEDTIASMLFHGASAFVMKTLPLEEIVKCIEEVHDGVYSLINYQYTLPVLQQLADMQTKVQVLSPKMREVLCLVCDERSNKEIADIMGLGIDSIKNCRKELFRITHSKNMAGLVKYAVQYGYVTVGK